MDERLEALEDRMRQGDVQALGEAFAMHRDRLRKLVHFRLDRRVQGRVDVDDVLQESYLAANTRLKHFGKKADGSSFVWLRLIVCQTLIDLYRRHMGVEKRDLRQEVAVYGIGYSQETSVSVAMHLFGLASSPSRKVAREETMALVQSAMANMEQIDQEVLALRHFEEMSNSEVAEALDITPKNASIRYVRAVKRLKKGMDSISSMFDGVF
mgnify:CR=1 FL=1